MAGKTCGTGNLDGTKTNTSSFPTKLLRYNLNDQTTGNTETELTILAFLKYLFLAI